MAKRVTKSDEEWKEQLTEQEYRVLRKADTDMPHKGEYTNMMPESGYFVCKGCGAPLYSAASKFKVSCGWPAFEKGYEHSISIKKDTSAGMTRTEILCSACDGHLGHAFVGEGLCPSNERHCVNSSSIKYCNDEAPSIPEVTFAK
eukprot:TRINITY_DN37744_c0_g1_i1.p1 TRINITY_DN37744_c0_g1~~TRINITY_DN37744_c0_g1_i1.p1  ORF type:complete len:170 (+),score=29.15 TRINITY_DN37744_c0_g1_i1:78-512(+)